LLHLLHALIWYISCVTCILRMLSAQQKTSKDFWPVLYNSNILLNLLMRWLIAWIWNSQLWRKYQLCVLDKIPIMIQGCNHLWTFMTQKCLMLLCTWNSETCPCFSTWP
jgi:hypothetical protein